ncbi:hypothetical protein W97_00029 [Coniosporium apollinis CBS 100218]|uniref:NADH dehydrogenase [ubiquinone] iron-sulfur protein 4, mitochondrial n=1 Tax=Coniosporium apollinis (strain CBS 100218) TaxID=1168221 RepID=R7YG00_CONA1|nr:uncharacterized protein W97_00029 [Coniosporium apollinis CBS 100218]EON60820.1 hypothetical protein W97_00029 [Coniosporium apollinis CBS 100218]
MSALQRSIGSRLIASAVRPTIARTLLPVSRAYSKATDEPDSKASTEDAPSARGGDSAMITSENAVEAAPRHQPDYNVAIDYRTSTFSPIPKRVMDGSEPGVSVAAAVLSGAPIDLQARTVRIYRPVKTATQSGDWNGHMWQIDWDVLGKGHRWENPLMGWQSSADFQQSERIAFRTKEEAINFANKQGYEYFVQEPNERRIIPKAYADQFVYSPKKLKNIRTK